MGLLERLRRSRGSVLRGADRDNEDYLRAWAGARTGVEAFVEPRTTMTETTVVFVAADGEWTRRRISGPDAARKLGRSLAMPVYDVQLVGYPRRMRDHDARQRILRDRERRGEAG